MNKPLFPLLLALLVSCSGNRDSDHERDEAAKDSLTGNEQKTSDQKQTNEDYRFDCQSLTKHTPVLEGDSISIQLTEKDIKDKDFREVQKGFYEQYIKGNELLQEWDASMEDDWETKHYHWGLIKREKHCLVIIYEYFIINHSEDRLFLLAIDDNGKLLNTMLVGDFTHYPDGLYETRAVLKEKKLKIFSVTDMFTGGYNEETGQYKHEKDSIATTYMVGDWKDPDIIKSDTSTTTYWK